MKPHRMFFLKALLAFCISSLAGGAAAMAVEGDASRAATAFSGIVLEVAITGDAPPPALLTAALLTAALLTAGFPAAAPLHGPCAPRK